MNQSLAILLLLTSVASSVGSTEIYVRKDSSGQPHYSDKPAPSAKPLAIQPGRSYHIVRYVYDGDTVLLHNRSKVRLSGINAPEIEHSRKSGEPGGEEAKIWLKKAVEGKKIYLEADVDRRDRYKRILAHVFTEEGIHINVVLVRLGLATANIYPPNLKYARQLLEAQRLAEDQGLGIWGDPAYQPKPVTSLSISGNYKGWQRLIGKPASLKLNRKYYRLIYSEQVDVRIPRANLDLFPDLHSYLGREMEIRGWPSRRKDHFSILVRHPSALRMMGDG